jgi:hypothetical protein
MRRHRSRSVRQSRENPAMHHSIQLRVARTQSQRSSPNVNRVQRKSQQLDRLAASQTPPRRRFELLCLFG